MTPPWDKDLETAFADPEQRAAVDAFLRTNVQPHVTKLETDYAATQDARSLYNDLTATDDEAAFGAFINVTRELYGDEAVQKLVEALVPGEPAAPATEPAAQPATPAELSLDNLPPQVRKAAEFVEQEEANREYDREMARIKAGLPEGTDLNEREFALSVMAAGGDFDQALDHYNERSSAWTPAAPETPPAPEPPATIGEGLAPQPTEEKYDTIDDALAAYFNETRASAAAPPPVGTV